MYIPHSSNIKKNIFLYLQVSVPKIGFFAHECSMYIYLKNVYAKWTALVIIIHDHQSIIISKLCVCYVIVYIQCEENDVSLAKIITSSVVYIYTTHWNVFRISYFLHKQYRTFYIQIW